MNIKLPLKITNPIDLFTIFQKHILSRPGGQNTFQLIQQPFANLNQCRAELDYTKYNQILETNPEFQLLNELESKILNYLHLAFFINQKFSFDASNKEAVYAFFQWTDSLNPKNSQKHRSFKYELIGHLYNLAIVNYEQGCLYLNKAQDQEKQNAIRKLRNAIWCIQEIREQLTQMQQDFNPPINDINEQWLVIFDQICVALSYYCLFDIQEKMEKQIGVTNIIGLANESAKHFKIAFNMFNQVKGLIPPQLQQKIGNSLLSFMVLTEVIACNKTALQHQNLAQDEPLKGHIGLAVSYLQVSTNRLQQVFKSKPDLPQLLIERLTKENLFATQNYNSLLQKNQQVYKHRVYNEQELPQIPELPSNLNIKPAQPAQLTQKLDFEEFFDQFLSPQMQQEVEEYKQFCQQRKIQVEQAINGINELKKRQYIENFLSQLLDSQPGSGTQSQSSGIPPQVKAGYDAYKKDGGKQTIDNLIQAIKDTSMNCGMMLENCKEKLLNEENDDKMYKMQYESKWNRIPSAQLNQEYMKSIELMKDKFKQAQV